MRLRTDTQALAALRSARLLRCDVIVHGAPVMSLRADCDLPLHIVLQAAESVACCKVAIGTEPFERNRFRKIYRFVAYHIQEAAIDHELIMFVLRAHTTHRQLEPLPCMLAHTARFVLRHTYMKSTQRG